MTELTVIASRRTEAVAMWVGGYVGLVIVQLIVAFARRRRPS